MKRFLAALALAGVTVIGTTGTANADTDDCTVQPLVAGECVTQPVADYVLSQLDTIAGLHASQVTLSAALIAEQAAHQETRLLMTAGNTRVTELESRLAKKQQTIYELRATIRNLRAQ
jgi:hypothetical protein